MEDNLHGRLPQWKMTLTSGNQQSLLCTYRSNQVGLKTTFEEKRRHIEQSQPMEISFVAKLITKETM